MDEVQPEPRLRAALLAPQKVAANASEPENHHADAGRLRHPGSHREVGRGKIGKCVASSLAIQVQHAGKNLQVCVIVTEIRRIHQARQIQALVEVDEESRARGRDSIRDQVCGLARTKRSRRIVIVVEVFQYYDVDTGGWNRGRHRVHEIDRVSRAEDCRVEREDIVGDGKVDEVLASDNLPSGSVQDIRSGERVCIECECCCMRGRAHYGEPDSDAIFSETQVVSPPEQELRVERLSAGTATLGAPAQHQSRGTKKPGRDVSVAFKSDFRL